MVLLSQNKGGAPAPPDSSKGQGMAKDQTAPTWGYQKGKNGGVDSKIFQLKKGEKLPSGWVDTPAKVKGAK